MFPLSRDTVLRCALICVTTCQETTKVLTSLLHLFYCVSVFTDFIFFSFKHGDTASPVASVPSRTTHVGKLKEKRAASFVAAWSTNVKPALWKTHTDSAGEFMEWSLGWVKSFYSVTATIDPVFACLNLFFSIFLSVCVCSSRHRSNAISGGKNVWHPTVFKAKAKRKSGTARRAKKLAAMSEWPQNSCSILSAVQTQAEFFIKYSNNYSQQLL